VVGIGLLAMEFPFDIAGLLGAPAGQDGPFAGRIDQGLLAGPGGEQLSELLASLREAGAAVRKACAAQGGCCPEDTPLPDHRPDDVTYVLAEGHDVLGFARVGTRSLRALPAAKEEDGILKSQDSQASVAVKGGYGAYQSSLQEIRPKCLLDFCVARGFGRRGLGRLLFDSLLEAEGNLPATRLAYFTPTEPMLAFLQRHFALGLSDGKMAALFLLFDDYFKEGESRREQLPAKKAVGAAQECDEPVLEEVPEMAELKVDDPLQAYKTDEDEYYKARTKLFCFNENLWQDAGAGEVHFLKQRHSGRIRLIWQQEKTNRIVANHFILNRAPFCDLQRHTAGNDKTWMWTAKERIAERRFALKFKSSEEAEAFRETFNEAKLLSTEKEPVDYVIVRKSGVTADLELRSRHVKMLPVAAAVKVVEVSYLPAEKHVRARIISPPGWVTLLSHGSDDSGTYAVERADMDKYVSTLKR